MSTNIYIINGYDDREDYLDYLSDTTGVPLDHVIALADILGPNEDFDGLVTSLQDHAYGY